MSTYLGQNFLKDSKFIYWAVQNIFNLTKKYDLNKVVEIGPGKGAITRFLVGNIPLFLFEKDRRFLSLYKQWWDLKFLGNKEKFEVWIKLNYQNEGQALAGDVKVFLGDGFNFEGGIQNMITLYLGNFLDASPNLDDFSQALFFGNLPYYITSPILIKIVTEFKPEVGLFMVQKEVGEKVSSSAVKKSYLRWILNYFYKVTCTKKVPARAFSPMPKVDSCWIRLEKKFMTPQLPLSWLKKFLDLTIAKRQTIKKNLKRRGIEFNLKIGDKRLQELSRDDMQILYEHLKDEI